MDAQAQLNVVMEKERSATEKELTLRSRVAALETQLSNVRQEKSQLLATVELERAKLETLEESQHRYIDSTFFLSIVCSWSLQDLIWLDGSQNIMAFFHHNHFSFFRESSKLEALRASYQKSLDELRKEKVCKYHITCWSHDVYVCVCTHHRRCWNGSWSTNESGWRRRAGRHVWSHRRRRG